jgi:HSP20 family molecular chaperone IbpA
VEPSITPFRRSIFSALADRVFGQLPMRAAFVRRRLEPRKGATMTVTEHEPREQARAVAHMYENAAEIVIELELPGHDADEIDVSLADHTVTVTGGHDPDPECFGKSYRPSSAFRRDVELPREADVDHLRATFSHGTLELRAPKQSSRPRRIPVQLPCRVNGDACAD